MNKKSFTLIELLVVIAIIGILSSLVIARFSDWGDNARIANTLQWSAGVHRTLGANLVGHWPLNGDLNDISGYGNHGSWGGDGSDNYSTEAPGSEGKSLILSSLSWVDVGNNPSLNIEEKITIVAWFKANPMTRAIISKGEGSAYDLEYLLLFSTDSNRLRFLINGGYRFNTATNTVLPEKWYHIVATYNRVRMRVYLNSEDMGSSGYTEKINLGDTAVNIGRTAPSTLGFDGLISDVRIYNTALTTEEVSRIYAETKDKYLAYE